MKVYVVTFFDEGYFKPDVAFLSEDEAAEFVMDYEAGYGNVVYHEVEVVE